MASSSSIGKQGFDFLDESQADEEGNVDLVRLRKLWLDERHAPELLPFENDLVERVRETIRFQQGSIEMLQTELLSNSENLTIARKDALRMEIPCMEMELDRVKYMLTALLRTRLKKARRRLLTVFDYHDFSLSLSFLHPVHFSLSCSLLI